jgi:NCAIR mutase (PurE)-related protein
MREVVYHGERAAEKKKREAAKEAKTRARGAVVKDPREEENRGEKTTLVSRGASDVVAARHRAHSASETKMDPAKRAPFRGKCT